MVYRFQGDPAARRKLKRSNGDQTAEGEEREAAELRRSNSYRHNSRCGEIGPLLGCPLFRWARDTRGGHTRVVIRLFGHRAEQKEETAKRQPSPRWPVCSQRLSPLTGPGEGITKLRSEWCPVPGRPRGPSRLLFSKSLQLGIQTMPLD